MHGETVKFRYTVITFFYKCCEWWQGI